jgi:hypothetical protein
MVVDRHTLTTRSVEWRDADGGTRQRLELHDYRAVGELVWPFRIVAARAGARLQIDFLDLELNGDLPEGAFRPPAGAWRPS